VDPDSIRSVDPDPDSGQKMTHKDRKKLRNFMFLSGGCSKMTHKVRKKFRNFIF
jgi:hypothetical protein